MVGHVLGKFAPDERTLLEEALDKSAEAAYVALKEGFEMAANRFNIRKEKKNKEKAEPQPIPAEPPTEEPVK